VNSTTNAMDQIGSTDRNWHSWHLDVSVLNIRTVSVRPELTQHTTLPHSLPQSSYKSKN